MKLRIIMKKYTDDSAKEFPKKSILWPIGRKRDHPPSWKLKLPVINSF